MYVVYDRREQRFRPSRRPQKEITVEVITAAVPGRVDEIARQLNCIMSERIEAVSAHANEIIRELRKQL